MASRLQEPRRSKALRFSRQSRHHFGRMASLARTPGQTLRPLLLAAFAVSAAVAATPIGAATGTEDAELADSIQNFFGMDVDAPPVPKEPPVAVAAAAAPGSSTPLAVLQREKPAVDVSKSVANDALAMAAWNATETAKVDVNSSSSVVTHADAKLSAAGAANATSNASSSTNDTANSSADGNSSALADNSSIPEKDVEELPMASLWVDEDTTTSLAPMKANATSSTAAQSKRNATLPPVPPALKAAVAAAAVAAKAQSSEWTSAKKQQQKDLNQERQEQHQEAKDHKKKLQQQVQKLEQEEKEQRRVYTTPMLHKEPERRTVTMTPKASQLVVASADGAATPEVRRTHSLLHVQPQPLVAIPAKQVEVVEAQPVTEATVAAAAPRHADAAATNVDSTEEVRSGTGVGAGDLQAPAQGNVDDLPASGIGWLFSAVARLFVGSQQPQPPPLHATRRKPQVLLETRQDSIDRVARATRADGLRVIKLQDTWHKLEAEDVEAELRMKHAEAAARARAAVREDPRQPTPAEVQERRETHMSGFFRGLEQEDVNLEAALSDVVADAPGESSARYQRLARLQDEQVAQAAGQLGDDESGSFGRRPFLHGDHDMEVKAIHEPWTRLEQADRIEEQKVRRDPHLRMLQVARRSTQRRMAT